MYKGIIKAPKIEVPLKFGAFYYSSSGSSGAVYINGITLYL